MSLRQQFNENKNAVALLEECTPVKFPKELE
jgi:hypothetical protein